MNVLGLFSGIGGMELGLQRAGFTIAAMCEIDPFCRAVLAKHWPNVKVYDDVCTLTADRLRADGIDVDFICGGFPCQDISSSGTYTGIIEGKKSGLWREFARIIREIRPRYALVENVSDLLSNGIGIVLGDLAEIGYDAEWHSISAAFVGLPQARERIWIIAYPCCGGRKASHEWKPCGPIARLRNDYDRLGKAQAAAKAYAHSSWRTDDGIPNWSHRITALGNAVVPQIPEIIGRAILAKRCALTDPPQ